MKKIDPKHKRISSRRWLERHINDPYVQKAQKLGYRSRAAFKIIEINEKFKLLQPGKSIIDLGCAPGGWSQIISQKLFPSLWEEKIPGDLEKRSLCIGVDLLAMEEIPGVNFLQGSFDDPLIQNQIKDLLKDKKADVVLSDMAPNTIGEARADNLRIITMAEDALEYAKDYLKEGGSFVVKVRQGGANKEMLENLREHFEKIKHFKPQSSRKESDEIYLVALGFKNYTKPHF